MEQMELVSCFAGTSWEMLDLAPGIAGRAAEDANKVHQGLCKSSLGPGPSEGLLQRLKDFQSLVSGQIFL